MLGFGTVKGSAQSKYAVEFVGGTKLGGIGAATADGMLNGITAGLGVSMYVGKSAELIGTTLFTRYPPSKLRTVYNLPTLYGSTSNEEGQYSAEINAGLRLHGRGSQIFHPYLVLQGGILFLRSIVYEGARITASPSAAQFLNIHGMEDIQMFETVTVGIGLQSRLTESVLLNLEAKYQLLFGSIATVRTFIPVAVSVQLPMQ